MTTTPVMPTESETDVRFDELQRQLVPQWRRIGSINDLSQTMVVVPSLSFEFEVPATVLQAYEERLLFLLLLLRKPRARIVYVTSQPVQREILDYYLGLLPGVVVTHARKRLHTLAIHDGASRPLTSKLLERPRLIEQIKQLVGDPTIAHLVPFNTTDAERELAIRLGIPMYGADPRFAVFGTKSGGRRLFAEEGVSHPLGIEGLRTMPEIVAAVAKLRKDRPGIRHVLTKLNEGVSGMGNATVDLSGLPAAGDAGEPGAIESRLRSLKLEAGGTVDHYFDGFAKNGGVVEERISGKEFRSPSVQLRVTPLGEVELLSTHDQMLGGPTGQSYLGCDFPADEGYAVEISREARKIGKRLAKEGVLGRFALDFVVAREPGEAWRVYAIEINLRKGGTTHPYLTLEFLTDGHYDAETGTFHTKRGAEKHYVASDHVESEDYRALSVEDLFDVLVRDQLHFSQTTQTGVVLHMLSTVTEIGRFGLTAVGDTRDEARALYTRAIAAFDAEARRAAEPLPPEE